MAMIRLMRMDCDCRKLEVALVNVDEISSVEAYHWHSFRPPSGSRLSMRNGDKFLVSDSPEAVQRLIAKTLDCTQRGGE